MPVWRVLDSLTLRKKRLIRLKFVRTILCKWWLCADRLAHIMRFVMIVNVVFNDITIDAVVFADFPID